MKKIIDDIFNRSQKRENVIGIWWYQIRTGILEYSEKALGHLDRYYFTLIDIAKTDDSVIRGRLIKVEGRIYLVIFSDKLLSAYAIMDLRMKLEEISSMEIQYVVDFNGNLLIERKTD